MFKENWGEMKLNEPGKQEIEFLAAGEASEAITGKNI